MSKIYLKFELLFSLLMHDVKAKKPSFFTYFYVLVTVTSKHKLGVALLMKMCQKGNFV